MIDHLSLGTRRFDEAIRFYSECFLPLGYQIQHRTQDEVAFGEEGKWTFWLYPIGVQEPAVGTRSHIAIHTDSKEKIVEFHQKAHERGATTVRVPGPRPDISPDYFGTVIRDLDGHTIEVVHWSM